MTIHQSKFVGILTGLAAAALINLAPWWFTRHAPRMDGLQTLGFPWAAYGRGGYSFGVVFNWQAAIADAAVAVALAWCVYKLVQLGPRHCWTTLRTWGTPNAP